jgi:hypothetical protein
MPWFFSFTASMKTSRHAEGLEKEPGMMKNRVIFTRSLSGVSSLSSPHAGEGPVLSKGKYGKNKRAVGSMK